MKLAPVLAFLFLAACGPASANSKVAGTYVLDTKAIADKATSKADGTADPEAQKMAAAMMPTGTLELAADGTAEWKMSFMGKQDDKKGNWKLDGDKITFTMRDGKEAPATAKYDNGTITMSNPASPGMTMVFHKK